MQFPVTCQLQQTIPVPQQLQAQPATFGLPLATPSHSGILLSRSQRTVSAGPANPQAPQMSGPSGINPIPRGALPGHSARGNQEASIKGKRSLGFCTFCRNQGGPESFYRSHTAIDASGNVLCPILRSHVCPICGASGANVCKFCPYF